MNDFLKKKMTQTSAWVAVAVIISAPMPPVWTMFLGLVLFFNDDEKLRQWATSIRTKVETWLG